MSLAVGMYSFVFVFYLVMGIFTFEQNKANKANRMFLILCSILAFWALCLAFMSVTNDANFALYFRRSSDISRSLLYATILNYMIIITQREKYDKYAWIKFLIYIPAVIAFIIYFFNPLTLDHIIKVTGTWAFTFPEGRGFLYNSYFNIYFSSYLIISLALLFRYSRRAEFIRERKRSKLIFYTLLLVGLIAVIPDVILPRLGFTRIPPVAVIITILAVIGVWVSIKKYSLMTLSGDNLLIAVSKIMRQGIIICDTNDKIIRMNTTAKEAFNCNDLNFNNCGNILNNFPKEIWDSKNSKIVFECEIQNSSGLNMPIQVSSNILKDKFGEKSGTVLYFEDMTIVKKVQNELIEEKRNLETRVNERTQSLKVSNKKLKREVEKRLLREKKIEKLAYSDYLTGLPNRRMFKDYLVREIAHTQRTKLPFAVLFIDLDGFKIVNDSLGHSNGDILLKEVSKRLVDSLRKSDIVTRLGGDEFAIILFNPADYKAIENICDLLLKKLEEPFIISDSEVHISASIGVSVCPNDSVDEIQLLKQADIAMYEAKENGKGQYSFFKKEKEVDLEESMKLTMDLYKALENNELEVYYQPQVASDNKRITGFEALVRWNHPKHGLVMPDKFINIAERTGLINSIGNWVLSTACKQLKIWNDHYNQDMKMAVNLSPRQLENTNMVEEISCIVNESGIKPGLIELEITENILMRDVEYAISVFQKLSEKGIHIAIDDYGTEYSSLSNIRRLAINRIKIPKSFIDGIQENKDDESIITSTIQLAKSLGMGVVAEGVEEEYQYNYLKSNNCETIQGYYFYRPMPSSQVESELELKN